MIRLYYYKSGDTPPKIDFLLEQLRNLPDGEHLITIAPYRKTRSNQQNAYLWGVVYPAVLFGLQDAGWEITHEEQVHEYCKQAFAAREVINKDTGEVLSLPSSTARMQTAEFNVYVDKIKAFALEYLNVTIPEPNEE
jgi:hypothetical protein